MLRAFFKKTLQIFWQPLVERYLRHAHWYRYAGVHIRVLPGVFHPGISYSTAIIIDELKEQDLRDKKVLELGAGSGLISVYCACHGANVTAVDIQEKAIENVHLNVALNHLSDKVEILQSDLFEHIPAGTFDFILINPPFYKGPADQAPAWYAGANMEYFRKLFTQMKSFVHSHTSVLLCFASVSELELVKQIGTEAGWHFEMIRSSDRLYEQMHLFSLNLKLPASV